MHDTYSLLQDLIQNHKSHRGLINQVTRVQSSRIKLNPTSLNLKFKKSIYLYKT